MIYLLRSVLSNIFWHTASILERCANRIHIWADYFDDTDYTEPFIVVIGDE